MENILILIGGVVVLSIGSVLGYLARQSIARKQVGTAEAKVVKMLEDAKHQVKEILIKAKEKANQFLEEAKKEQKEKERQIIHEQERLERREQGTEKRAKDVEVQYAELLEKAQKVKEIKEELEKAQEQKRAELEKVSQMTQDQAKQELLVQTEKDCQEVLFERIKKLEDDGREELEKKAKNIITLAMQRYAASQAAEITTSSVALPSDDLKGRIIGKEGRNIKTLEKMTGVEIIVDDTPGAVVISAFDPIRRQIAKIALEKLMAD